MNYFNDQDDQLFCEEVPVAEIAREAGTPFYLYSHRTLLHHFRILRSEAAADQACPGCPQDYRLFATLKVADQTLRREGGKGFSYVDAAVTEGRFYSYRVSACDSRGHCGQPSASAQRLREKR